MHILPNISRTKGNQALKFCQVIVSSSNVVLYILVFVYYGFYERTFFYYMYIFKMGKTVKQQKKKRKKKRKRDPELFLFFRKALYELKANGVQLSFNEFPQSSTWQTIKTKHIKLQNIDPEIYSILIFQKRALEQFLYHILCMNF